MKNLVVLGCSHSSWRTHNRVWPIQLAERYSNINVLNYSLPGHGHYYMDLCLKHLMYENKMDIDWIIVQFTGIRRFTIPVFCAEPEEMWKHVLPDDANVPNNYNELALTTSRRLRIQPLNSNEFEDIGTISSNASHGKMPTEGVYSEPEYFTELFKKQIIDMAKYLPISCFTMWNIANLDNIGMKETFYNYMKRTYGSLDEYFDETQHFNGNANTILLDKLESLPLFNQHLH